jgi:hypothetical protein
MRFVALLIVLVAGAPAQTIAVTAPTANQTLAGPLFTLASVCTSCPTVNSVEYDVDGEMAGITRTAPYSLSWDTFYSGNGLHSITATARDALNNVLATSSAISFSVENNQPQNTCPPNGSACTDMSVTTGEVARIGISGSLSYSLNVVSFVASGGPISLAAGSPHIADSNTQTWTWTAGNTVVCGLRWQSSSSTASFSGATFVPATVEQSSGGFSSQWFYAINVAGGSTTATASTTGGSILATACYELHPSSGSITLDVNTGGPGSSFYLTSPQFTLSGTQANEIILVLGTCGGAPTFTAGVGYTLLASSGKNLAVEYIVPPASGWFSTVGITATVNGGNSAISKTFQVNVDGFPYVNGVAPNPATAASYTTILYTNQFLNTSHNIVVTSNGGNCAGCINGAWNILGQWEQQATFVNGSQPSQLLANYRDAKLCVTPSTNCPSSIGLTATIQNADGTTSPASSATWVSNNTSIVTLSASSGASTTATVVGGAQNNAVSITITAVTGGGTFTHTTWINVPPDAVGANTPHFGRDGSIITTGYNAAKSFWYASTFGTNSSGINPFGVGGSITSSINYEARYLPAYVRAFTAAETGMDASGTVEATYDSTVNANIAKYVSWQTNYGLTGIHLIGDSVFKTTYGLFSVIYGASANTFATPAVKYWLNQAATQGLHIIGADMADEVSWPSTPFAGVATGGLFVGTNGFVSVDCTVSPAKLNTTSGVFGGLIQSSTFIITGSGDSTLDYNTTSGNAAAYVATPVSGGYTFPRPAGCATLHNASTNPNMLIEPLVAFTADAGAATANMVATHSCPGGGGGGTSAGPCPLYNHYDALYKFRQQWLTAANPPAMTAPIVGGVGGDPVSWWSGKFNVGGVSISDYYTLYLAGSSDYLADKNYLIGVLNNQGNAIRSIYQATNLGAPLISESYGTVTDYMAQGFPISIAACAGNTITTTNPHGVFNIYPNVTRMVVKGSSGANCDGYYYIISAPTATTLTVAQANTSTTVNATGGTITFQDGATWPLATISASTSGNTEAAWEGSGDGTCPNTWKNNRGKTFTLSGTSQSVYNSSFTGIFMADTLDVCPAPGSGGASYWRQIPNITASTGGTAQIVKNHYYLRGDSWQTNSETGPRSMFVSHIASLIWGVAGVRVYQGVEDPQLTDLTLVGLNGSHLASIGSQFFNVVDFNCNYSACPQAGIDPNTDYAKTFVSWNAHQNASLMAQREIPYAFGQRLPAPDYGQFYEAAAWTSARGNLLAIQSFADNTTSLTANLSPYLVSGQAIDRICATWNSIKAITVLAAGTTSDTINYDPGQHCAYLFPLNAAAELQQPILSARLADVANAAKVVVQFSYAQLAFTGASVGAQMLYQTQDCGNAANCLLNVDRSIGTVFYRLVYLNSSNAVIATSDLQTF